MARAGSGKSRGKKAPKRKRKIAVSPKPQAGTAPYVPDTTSWDAAAELITRRPRGQTAATVAQPPMSPGFPGNIPSQVAEAAGSAPGAGAAAGASIAAAAGSAAGADATLSGESSLVADATVSVDAYGQMLARLTELEATVAQLLPLLPSTPGIGHNNPPPLERAELEEIKGEIALLKAQPPPPPAEANNIARKFVRLSARVLTWVGKHLDTFVTEFSKSAGHEAGKAVVQLPKWYVLGSGLVLSAAAIMKWLMTLPGLGQ
jgi:hypothetical protein